MDSDGNDVTTGDVDLSTDRRQMTATLQSGLGAGRYIVYWSTFDDVDGGASPAATTSSSDSRRLTTPSPTAKPWTAAAIAPRTRRKWRLTPPQPHRSRLAFPTSCTAAQPRSRSRPPTSRSGSDGSTVDPHFGHYHIYLDKVPVDVLTGTHTHMDMSGSTGATGSSGAMDMSGSSGSTAQTNNPGGLVENPVMVVADSYTFTNLARLSHRDVVVNYDNHTPFNPPVIESKTFRVEDSSSGSGDDIPSGADHRRHRRPRGRRRRHEARGSASLSNGNTMAAPGNLAGGGHRSRRLPARLTEAHSMVVKAG